MPWASPPAERPVPALMIHYGKLSFIRGLFPHGARHVVRSLDPGVSGLMTPFRRQLVCLVSELVRDSLGLVSEPLVTFDAWSPPEEDAGLVLLVTLFVPNTVDLRAVRSLVFQRIAEWSRLWNRGQQEDFRKHIYIDIDSQGQ